MARNKFRRPDLLLPQDVPHYSVAKQRLLQCAAGMLLAIGYINKFDKIKQIRNSLSGTADVTGPMEQAAIAEPKNSGAEKSYRFR